MSAVKPIDDADHDHLRGDIEIKLNILYAFIINMAAGSVLVLGEWLIHFTLKSSTYALSKSEFRCLMTMNTRSNDYSHT